MSVKVSDVASNFDLVQRTDYLKTLCDGKRVLHLGCTNAPYTAESLAAGTHLHLELESSASDLWGIDSDAAGLAFLRSTGSTQLIHGDLESLSQVEVPAEFDVILAGEIIEHLNNPGLFLNGVGRFMTSKTRLVITTVNAYCGMRFVYYGLRGKRGRQEPVHPDHVAYYSYSTLSKLIERHGYVVDRFVFYDVGREHRPHNRWFLNGINDVLVKVAPQWADGIIAECRLAGVDPLQP